MSSRPPEPTPCGLVYPGYEVVERWVEWDPTAIAVNGSSTGRIDLSPAGNNEVLSITTVQAGYGATIVSYFMLLQNPGGGPGVNAAAQLRVVEEKAVLRQLEFTSDHNVIRENTLLAFESGDRYKDVEFVRRTKYNAPMTQTMSYVGAPSKMKVKVVVDWAGIPAHTPVKLVGTSTENALQFASGKHSTSDIPGTGLIEITATNDVGGRVKTISGSIDWTMVVNPGAANEKTLPMGTSGPHKIYVLFGSPAEQNRKLFQATDKRMDRTVAVASQALDDAIAKVAPASPTWQRIAFHIVQLQRFNLYETRVRLPIDDDQLNNGWIVYDTWTGSPGQGVDCISGAAFSLLVVKASGMPGTSSIDAFVAKSETEPTKAVSYVPDAASHRRNENKEQLGHRDNQDPPRVNWFEATLIYKPQGVGTSTFFFPVGAGDAKFTNKDDVITIFKDAVWVNRFTGAVVEILQPPYTRAANVNID